MFESTFIGNLGADAVVKDFNGKKFITFSACSTDYYTDALGNKQERPTWISARKPFIEGSKLPQCLLKGTTVYLRGRVNARAYTDSNGLPAAGINLFVYDLDLVGPKKQSDASAAASAAPAAAPMPYQMPVESDLQF